MIAMACPPRRYHLKRIREKHMPMKSFCRKYLVTIAAGMYFFSPLATTAHTNNAQEDIAHSSDRSYLPNLASFADRKKDATAAIQALIDNSPTNGEVKIPGGTYLINPDVGISLHSGTHLILSNNTTLLATTSSQRGYVILKAEGVRNASVTGGAIVGERNTHIGHEGQWGMGISILGSTDITISDIRISNCWGDGIYIGSAVRSGTRIQSENVIIKNVVSDSNRRQGLSVTGGKNIQIIGSTFSRTNGHSPQSGIDLEPNRGDVADNIVIKNSYATNNAGFGIVSSRRSSNVKIINCIVTGNNKNGVVLYGASKVEVKNNHIENNGGYDIFVSKGTTEFSLSQNTLTESSTLEKLLHKNRVYIYH